MTGGYSSYSGYRDLTEALTAEFGTEFYVTSTGGGCMAVEAILENGYLLITDAEDTLSSTDERIKAQNRGCGYGYAVGIYRTTRTGDDNVAFVADLKAVTTADVIALVKAAFLEVVK